MNKVKKKLPATWVTYYFAMRVIGNKQFLRLAWFQGPPFLWQNENNWPCVKGVEVQVLTDDPELRREAKSYATFVPEDRGLE